MITDQKLVTILDDAPEIRDMLSKSLSDAGFATKSYGRALEFERDMRTISPDVCIIDLGLPDKDGLALVNKTALESGAAIIIISGRSMIQDKIAGLELGADDYITKPFELAEVIARVRALLRRNKDVEYVQKQVVHFSGWTADFDQHTLIDQSGNIQSLSFAEAQVLRLFLDAPNRLITREYILDNLGSAANDNFERAIDVRISRLRTKLKDNSQNPKLIKTIYGAGYIFIGETS